MADLDRRIGWRERVGDKGGNHFLPHSCSLVNTGQTGGTADADIDGPEAWDLEEGSPEVIVAVTDTGIDYTAPDLIDNMWTNDAELLGVPNVDDDGNGIVDDIFGARFSGFPTTGDPFDDHCHGTLVAGIIGRAEQRSRIDRWGQIRREPIDVQAFTSNCRGSTCGFLKLIV